MAQALLLGVMMSKLSEQCKQSILDHTGFHSRRCSRYAVKDGYCKQHHPESVKERERKSIARFEEQLANSPSRKLKQAEERIKELEAQLAKAHKEGFDAGWEWAIELEVGKKEE